MNGNIGPGERWSGFASWAVPITKTGNFTTPGASMSWVFMDEHPDWLDDAQLYVNPAETNGIGEYTELPGALHNNACGISFADGHAEIHKWLDSRTLAPVTLTFHPETINITTPSKDLAWLALRTPFQ
jgi:prepilin-type processing-associated H-X9-DG protein